MVKLADYINSPKEWNEVAKSKNFEHSLNISGENIENENFEGFDFSRVNFVGCTFKNCNFSKAIFSNTKTATADNNGSKFIECNFSHLNIKDNQLIMHRATFELCTFENSTINNASMQNSNFFNCIWHNAKLEKVLFGGSSFLGSDFSKTEFRFCRFLNTMWQDVIIGPQTNYEYCTFSPPSGGQTHDILNDKSDQIKFATPHQWWNWRLISKIGRIPALEFSWTLFVVCLFILSSIIFVNESQFISEGIKYPIPIPYQLSLLTLGALFTSIGTFLYRAGCPDRIQNFTENEWVEGHGHPRLFYREYCVKKIRWLWATTIFLVAGLLILGGLLAIRMCYVVSHLIT